ncbi:MAG: discoidin domain-containing protein [Alphaproteobacteria bacterium]
MKKGHKKQFVISQLMGNPVKNKDINTAGCPIRSGMTEEHTQSGRSMVEMLGVLAIMGVLSVGGVAMYTTAMNKHRANELLNEAQKRASVVVPQILLMENSHPSLNEFINNNLGYGTFDTTVYTQADNLPNGQFGLKVSDVSKAVCQNILNTIGENTVIRRLSTPEAPRKALTSCADTNTFLMVYNNDMSTNTVAEEFDYDNCPESFYQCSTTHSCVASENDCPSVCAVDEELSSGCFCPERRDRTGDVCGDCIDIENYAPWTQPVLTSNGTMGGSNAFACSASGAIGYRQAWRAFDNSNKDPETDCWHSSLKSSDYWLSWYTKKPTKINSLTIHNRGDGGAVGVLAVADFQIQYSDDNSSWTTVVSGKNPSNSPYSSYSQTVGATSGHNYWRIYILSRHHPAGITSTDYVTIGELTINADEVTVTDYELNESGYCEVVE